MGKQERLKGELLDALEAEFRNDSESELPYPQYVDDPVGFIEQELGATLTIEQKEIALSVRDQRETNVQAAHGVGKSYLAARLVLWWVLCVGGLGITTAPTARQVQEILWGEIRSTLGRLLPDVDSGMTFMRINEDARAFGFTSSPKNSNAFQGIHNANLLVIQDEACGITQEIDDGSVSCTTGSTNRLLRIGNPIIPNNPFQQACAKTNIRLPVWNHPNVAWAYEPHPDGIHRLKPEVAKAITGPDGHILPQSNWPEWCPKDPIPGAISVYYIEETARPKGEDSAFWQSRIEGLFPEDAAAAVIPRTLFQEARMRYDSDPDKWRKLAAQHNARFGMDIGDGADAHALARWQGPVLLAVKKSPTKGDMLDTNRAAGLAGREMNAHGPATICVDRGFGSGVVGALLEQGHRAEGVHWGSAAKDSGAYANAKAEDFWLLREAMRRGEVAIAPLGAVEDEVREDLAAIYYEETRTGKIQMEKKAETKKRLKRSPDCGDSVVLGFRTTPVREGSFEMSSVAYG